MPFQKKIDRAFQWAGEKMGGEAKTTMSDDFKTLETEMALRFEGMDRLQRSMNQYVKWLGRRLESYEDRDKSLPIGFLGRTMVDHGEEFQADSEFGNCLITMGRANERISAMQESFVNDATESWLESLERSLAMMKEYQTARKKLENRRLNFDASTTKLQKAKRDDFRLEEELRANKAKYEESSEDVLRRMQDIQDAEVDSVRDLTQFLDAEIDYHERCAEELRRARQEWPAASSGRHGTPERRPTIGSRSHMSNSYTERTSRSNTFGAADLHDTESSAPPVRMPIRPSNSRRQSQTQAPDYPVRPTIGKSSSFQGGASLDRERGRIISGASTPSISSTTSAASHAIPNVGALRGQLRPVSRIVTASTRDNNNSDVFADRDDDTGSDGGSPDWGHRSVTSSAATSVASLSRTPSHTNTTINNGPLFGMGGVKKAPPPPPPSRAKKPAPPPPVPARREVGY